MSLGLRLLWELEFFGNSFRMWLSAIQVFAQKKKQAPVYSTHWSHLRNLAASSSDVTTCGPQNLQRGTQHCQCWGYWGSRHQDLGDHHRRMTPLATTPLPQWVDSCSQKPPNDGSVKKNLKEFSRGIWFWISRPWKKSGKVMKPMFIVN